MNRFYCNNPVCSRRLRCQTAQQFTRDKQVICGIGDSVSGCQDYVPLKTTQKKTASA